jgi:hypothetical protein
MAWTLPKVLDVRTIEQMDWSFGLEPVCIRGLATPWLAEVGHPVPWTVI